MSVATSNVKVMGGFCRAEVIEYLKIHNQPNTDTMPKVAPIRRTLLLAFGVTIARRAIVKGMAIIKSIR